MQRPIPIPASLQETVSEWEHEIALSFVDGMCVWRLRNPDGDVRYLKLRTGPWDRSLADERVRLQWAAGHLVVPAVLAYGRDGDVEWLLTTGLPGRDAADPDLKQDPTTLVPLLAQGLHRFHQTVAEGCPFDYRLEIAIDHVRRRVHEGRVDPQDFHHEHRHLTPEQALQRLEATRPETEDIVPCHGDYCLPNVLIDDGQVVGYIDLGDLGLADRWWDLAVGTWSVTWNLGSGWEDLFYEAYGVEPDHPRVKFYRLLYDLH